MRSSWVVALVVAGLLSACSDDSGKKDSKVDGPIDMAQVDTTVDSGMPDLPPADGPLVFTDSGARRAGGRWTDDARQRQVRQPPGPELERHDHHGAARHHGRDQRPGPGAQRQLHRPPEGQRTSQRLP